MAILAVCSWFVGIKTMGTGREEMLNRRQGDLCHQQDSHAFWWACHSSLSEFAVHELAVLSLRLCLGDLLGKLITAGILLKGMSSHFPCSGRLLTLGQNLAADRTKRSDHQHRQLKLKWKMREAFGLASGVPFRKPLQANTNAQGCFTSIRALLHTKEKIHF